MLKKLHYFIFLLILPNSVVNVASTNGNKSLDNVIQSKIIHIIDLKGILGALEINASKKNIETLNITSNYNDTLLQALDQRWISDQSRNDQIEVQAVAIQQLKEQLSELEESVYSIRNELAKLYTEESEATSCLGVSTLVHPISVPGTKPFYVQCDGCSVGSGWIVIQSRQHGNEGFFRSWREYRNGFGYFHSDFFLGLEYIYLLTSSQQYELYIELTDFDNNEKFARYNSFQLGSEQEKYMLKSLGAYHGNAGNSLQYNLNDKFSTYDSDNDDWLEGNCARYYESGWWFGWDVNSNLNGRYIPNSEYNVKGIWWYDLHEYYSLKSVRMLIRPTYSLIK